MSTSLPRFHGSLVALITPFKDGGVDGAAFEKLVHWQIENGTHGLVPVGTTGESPTLSPAEHDQVIELCVKATAGRVPVIAGAGSNSTEEAIAHSRHAEKVGADALLHVTPYYNKPTQEGLYRHFKAIHDSCGLPIFLYNIPGRSVIDMSVETMARLAELPRIIGVKDAAADLARPVRTRRACGREFIQLSGDDAVVLPFLVHGAVGCISVTANIAPRALFELHEAWAAGDVARAQAINEALMPVHEAMFCETSPGPVKYAASLLGLCGEEVRLPLAPIADSTRTRVQDALAGAGLLPTALAA